MSNQFEGKRYTTLIKESYLFKIDEGREIEMPKSYHVYDQVTNSEVLIPNFKPTCYQHIFDKATELNKELEAEVRMTSMDWISLKDKYPSPFEYDWVLVTYAGSTNVPHIAELRSGVWYAMEYEQPLEEIIQESITHWMPLPESPIS